MRVILACFIFISSFALGQKAHQHNNWSRSELGLLGGVSYYIGDLNQKHFNNSNLAELQKRLGAIPTPARIYAATTHKPETCYLLERGSVLKTKEEVQPGALSMVSQLPALLDVPAGAEEGQRRIALARWITDPHNPLTARVIVNRVW